MNVGKSCSEQVPRASSSNFWKICTEAPILVLKWVAGFLLRQICKVQEKREPLHQIFFSIFLLIFFSIEKITCDNQTLTNFYISQSRIIKISYDVNVKKTQGPNRLPQFAYRNTIEKMSNTQIKFFKNVNHATELAATQPTRTEIANN